MSEPASSSRGGGWILLQVIVLLGHILATTSTHHSLPAEWRQLTWGLGWLLTVAGVAAFARAVLELGRAFTPYPLPNQRGPLVTHGLFALVRHPIYFAALVILLGWALLWHSWPGLALLIIPLAFFDQKAAVEESALHRLYPGDYAAYAQRVKKLLPGVY
jgi:protein-S-isoprenylcysteine O-methyltransferase Ste14